MDIQTEKNTLIGYISQIKDVKVIERILEFVKANESDFWNDLSGDQKDEIKKGIEELGRGEKFLYEDVVKKHR